MQECTSTVTGYHHGMGCKTGQWREECVGMYKHRQVGYHHGMGCKMGRWREECVEMYKHRDR